MKNKVILNKKIIFQLMIISSDPEIYRINNSNVNCINIKNIKEKYL